MEQTAELDLYPGAQEYLVLSERLQRLYREVLLPREHIGCKQWPVQAFFGLVRSLGLERIRINAWGYCYALDDTRVTEYARQAQRQAEFEREQSWLKALLHGSEGELLADHGFTRAHAERLIALSETRYHWLMTTRTYDWNAGLSVAVAGNKVA